MLAGTPVALADSEALLPQSQPRRGLRSPVSAVAPSRRPHAVRASVSESPADPSHDSEPAASDSGGVTSHNTPDRRRGAGPRLPVTRHCDHQH